ncbi:SCO3242 family prenyltransferase [Streptomyces sp. NPDC060028]|uniref:SCO3242 family prenyltransferase n=1 Tax=Streptomyces sp. NPDC060028 TaxID=3347041 RepID=UPI0036CFD366
MSGRGREGLVAWAQLLRISALFTVPGDALAGAAAAGVRPGPRTALAVGASLCLYSAGMALNDWADREEDALERPGRPIPSGRIRPGAALAAAGGLTAAGVALAACAGRRPAAVAGVLAGTVWAYDLGLKHTPAGPAAMAAARSLDLLLGAVASGGVAAGAGAGGGAGAGAGPRAGGGGLRPALASAGMLGVHTYAVTAVSRRETQGGAPATALAALANTAVLAVLTGGGSAVLCAVAPAASRAQLPSESRPAASLAGRGPSALLWALSRPTPPGAPALRALAAGGLAAGLAAGLRGRRAAGGPAGAGNGVRDLAAGGLAGGLAAGLRALGADERLRVAAGAGMAGMYAATAGRPLWHAALNPSPPLTQRAVGGGIRAMIPLQAALAARAGAPGTALVLAGLVPVARRLARKVSPT